jgi:hypothetical protein
MRGVAGVGSEVTGSTMGLEAHGSPSGSDRSGGHTGDPMAIPMPTPMPTRRLSPCHPPKSMYNPQHRPLPSLLHRPLGIIVTIHGGIIPTCSNVQGDGGQYPPRRHKRDFLTQV